MWKKKFTDFGLWVLLGFTQLILRLRYRIHVKGLDALKEENLSKKGGILFLPNHPAEIEPIILMTLLWKRFRPRPLAVERFYYLVPFLMKCIGALPLPDIRSASNRWKAKQVEKRLNDISEELKKRENFLVYPGGKVKLTPYETLGGNSLVHNILQRSPDTNIVLIRTTGLWGSSFSTLYTGRSPDFWTVLKQGIKTVFKNGIFFIPKREVNITIEVAPKDFPATAERLEMNKYLEDWYNRYPDKGPEPLSQVSYAFWKNELLPLPQVNPHEKEREAISIDPQIEEEVKSKLAALAKRSKDEVQNTWSLSTDLGLDSLDVAQVYIYLDQRFEKTDISQGSLQTVEDVLRAASDTTKKIEKVAKEKIAPFWPAEKERTPPAQPQGKTIQEAFLTICKERKNEVTCADALSSMLRYKKLKRATLILSKYIEKLEGDNIGIMLPSSVGAYLCILATLLAKKVPVMLNWTAGTRSLEHSLKVTKLKHVISSWRFLDKLESGDIGPVDEMLIFLEDVKRSLTLKEKLAGLFSSFLSAATLKEKYASIHEEDTAVILFTSGTESLPKAVPLSHKNILSNQAASLTCVTFTAKDLLYAILPPFHSFGFSITGLLPLLSGLKVFYAPDPTNSRGIAHDIFHYKPTFFCAAPSFILSVFRVASLEHLKSVTLFVAGAEKAPQELWDYVSKLGKGHTLLEGYGITECAPVVALNRPETPARGVGKPLPGVEICIIDLATKEKLSFQKEGEICIYGPNVFKGYIGHNANPFIEIEGKKWYLSGDRGYLEEDGSLVLSGRLKRFVKIGGEMVSLAGLEEEVEKISRAKKWHADNPSRGPTLAVSVKEKEGDKPEIILYTTYEMDRDALNTALNEEGYGRIVKISCIKQLKEIPLTGTGKTHYRLLDEMDEE